MLQRIKIFDSSLRDGAQAKGISFSVEDKIKIVQSLDDLGIHYVEAGNPGSNSKDMEFFNRVKAFSFKHVRLTAFGSTRRKNISVEEDSNVQSLLKAYTPAIAIFGKSWDFHVTDVIKTTLEENLNMIKDTIGFFKKHNKEVMFDAEHFFDGYKFNKGYAIESLKAAVEGGVDSLVLCDTNGGTFPEEVYQITKEVVEMFDVEVGIHCHNDCGMAVANSIMAVNAGAIQVQGTFLGFGERCGNANLSTIIPNLQMKKGCQCISEESLQKLTDCSKYIAEVTNINLDSNMPYVGQNAFAHKGGMHIDGVTKASHSFEHISPECVGNYRTFLMSEVSGKNTIIKKIQKVEPSITKSSKETEELVDLLKELEHEGYQFEGAESSFEMVIRKHLGKYKPLFNLKYYRIIEEEPVIDKQSSASAMIKISVDGKEEMTATEGNGPVNALDKAIRKALEVFYPSLKEMYLTDYKVRVLDESSATASKVRVLIESSDGKNRWTTVGVSSNIIEASKIALVDSIEYKLIKDMEKNKFI
ncbi:MAG: citramalate synthase [Clostridia bacterium]|nr:citramalate synthase [Clostridia bacterium]